MCWRKFALLLLISGFAGCKGAKTSHQETPEEKRPIVNSQQASGDVVESENGDILVTGEQQDTAVTPVLVTGTYLTCVDLPVTRHYDYEERGRIVGCRLVDRKTGQQVAMERVAHNWSWQVEVPAGVNAEQRIDNSPRALHPLVLELKGTGSDGKDILTTLVTLTMDLLVEVDDPMAGILTLVLNEVLKAIPPNLLDEQLSTGGTASSTTAVDDGEPEAQNNPPPSVVQEGDPEPQSQPESQTQIQQQTQTQQATGGDQETQQAVPAELPEKVVVRFALTKRPTGAQVTMTPDVPSGVTVSKESFQVSGEIISDTAQVTSNGLRVSWRYPVSVSFELDGKVTCRGDGFVGTTAREVEAKCQ